MVSVELSYYYGYESEQFSFYRIPKLLFTDSRFANLSTDAKLLYGILLDRMSLSMKNGWHDEQGRVYIIFTLEDVTETLGYRTEKAIKLFHELDTKKGVGLIERVRQGQGRPALVQEAAWRVPPKQLSAGRVGRHPTHLPQKKAAPGC